MGVTLRRAVATIAALRSDSEREITHWRELISWSDGCRQGREDVASIVPLLPAAQQPFRPTASDPDQSVAQ
jgi:hypothetical protein